MQIKGNKKRTWLVALAILPLIAGAQQPATAPVVHEFTIQQAVDYAMKNSWQVKNALLDVQVQQQTNREVTGSAYPQLSANGSLTYNAKLPVSLVPAEFFGGPAGTFQELAFGVKWNSTGGVSLSQILFDGQVFTGLQARQTLIDFANKNVEITEENIRANIHKVYYQLVTGRDRLTFIDSNIALLEKLRHDTKIMYDNGFAEKLDVDKTSVQIANLQTEKIKAINQLSNGFLGLKVLLGMPIRDSLVLTDKIDEQQLREGILEASTFNYAQRRDFQYADLGVRLKNYDVQRYKYSKIPTLSLNGYYNKNAQRDEFDFFKGGRWFDISAFTLDLKIPIFSGFSTNARIAKAKLEAQKSINQRESLKIDIDNQIETAKNNFNSAIASLDYQKDNKDLAETVYQQTKKKYEIGTGSQTEINTAQQDLIKAQDNYINAIYDAINARVDFLKATGKL